MTQRESIAEIQTRTILKSMVLHRSFMAKTTESTEIATKQRKRVSFARRSRSKRRKVKTAKKMHTVKRGSFGNLDGIN